MGGRTLLNGGVMPFRITHEKDHPSCERAIKKMPEGKRGHLI